MCFKWVTKGSVSMWWREIELAVKPEICLALTYSAAAALSPVITDQMIIHNVGVRQELHTPLHNNT